MPNLEKLVGESDWAGKAIAPSSWGLPALGSLHTGLRPWQHQAIHGGRPELAPELVTLAEALRALDYTTAGYPDGAWTHGRFGQGQGFDAFAPLGRGRRALDRLTDMGAGRHFVWIHFREPGAPYIRRDAFLPRLGPGAPQLPRRILPAQLEQFFDPAVSPTPGQRRRFQAMYRLNAAWADERLGRFLEVLRTTGRWDRTLLVVTSIHGEELGEHGQILTGGNLGRALLEVPLVIKLPQGFERPLAEPAERRVGLTRLWATLVEAAGGTAPPAVAPSLFRQAPPQVLSELYLTNGTNQFSLVDGDLQLRVDARFAPPEPDYYLVRQAMFRPKALQQLPEQPAVLFGRLERAFGRTPPLQGAAGMTGSHLLERWLPAGGTRRIDDRARAAEMKRRLDVEWHRFVPEELAPDDEAFERMPPGKRRPRPAKPKQEQEPAR
jgi:arylsulfatase A-like enzyme